MGLREERRLFLGVADPEYARTTLYERTPEGFEEFVSVTGTLKTISSLHQRI